MFKSVIDGSLDINSMIIIMISGIVLGLIISIVHMKTSNYSKNFLVSLAIMPLLVSTVLIIVNGNLGTGIAVLGAFSLVRFRSMPGNSKEIISVFFAMTIGIIIGAGQILFACIITLVVSLMFIVLSLIKFGDNTSKILDIVVSDSFDYEEFNELFKTYLSRYELIRVKTVNLGSLYELKYEVSMKDTSKIKELIDEIRIRNGNLKVSMYNKKEDMTL